MSYIPLSFHSMEKSLKNVYRYTLPLNGVRFSENPSDFEQGRCRVLENLNINSSSLSTAKGYQYLFDDFTPQGSLYSITKEDFCGKIIMHIGQSLYCFDGKGDVPLVISSELPNKQSVFTEFLSKLYIYCDRHVYTVDSNFEFKEQECDAPLFYTDMHPSNTNTGKKVNDFVPNLIAPRISVNYLTAEVNNYLLPAKCDVTRYVEVIIDGETIPQEEYKVKESMITFSIPSPTSGAENVTIKYYVKNDEDIGYTDELYGCTLATVYGGNNLSGTRVFLTGHPEKKGGYFKSALLNPLYFSNNDYEIVGDGCDNVTGLMKMYGSLIIFTEKSVYRMQYSSYEEGPVFSIKQISCESGCDIPESIELIDNRVVFANSKKGIFIVDSAEESGEHNIKPISGNVDRNGVDGFFDHTQEELKKACSIDFDRKYILCIGCKALVWDYDKSSYISSSSYSKSQGRLIWSVTNFEETDGFLNLSGVLCGYSKETGVFFRYDADSSQIPWRMLSGRMNFGTNFEEKFVTDMSIVLKIDEGSKVNLRLFCDTEEYYRTPIECDCGKNVKLDIKLPAKKLYNFEFEIKGQGLVEIYDIQLKYKILK